MSRMKGAEVITEYLIKQKIPYVFGICGHGNVGLLDALYDAREQIKLISPPFQTPPRCSRSRPMFRLRNSIAARFRRSTGISRQIFLALSARW